MADDYEEQDVYEVEKILKMKVVRGRKYYRLRWKGYEPSQDTWELENNLIGCEELLRQFHEEMDQENCLILHPKHPSPRYESRDKFVLKQSKDRPAYESLSRREETTYEYFLTQGKPSNESFYTQGKPSNESFYTQERPSNESFYTQEKPSNESVSTEEKTYTITRWLLDISLFVVLIVGSVLFGLYYCLVYDLV